MRKQFKILIGIFMFLSVIGYANAAVNIDIDVNPTFKEGETVEFSYTIYSDEEQGIRYIETIDCPNAPIPLLQPKNAVVSPANPVNGKYIYGEITKDIEPQDCKAVIFITQPTELTQEKTFEIIAKPSFDFNLVFCKDALCSEKSKVFSKNERVYIDYESDTANLDVEAVLISPDNTAERLNLPTSITPNYIGTFTLEVVSSKNGYKTISTKGQFAVIEKSAEIKDISVCEVNGICNNNENRQNCPQDCAAGVNDNYCDKELDGKCDPDCVKGEDQDCYADSLVKVLELEKEKEEVMKQNEGAKKTVDGLIVLAIILAVIVILLFLSKKKRNELNKN